MEENKTATISQRAWKIYGIDSAKISSLLVLVYAILLVSMALGLWIGGTFVVFFLLLGVPAIFAAFLWLFGLKKEKNASFMNLPRMYFAYFNPPFRGVFRAITSFLKSGVVFLVATSICVLIYYFASPNFDPAFQSALQDMVAAYQANDLTAFSDLVNNNASIVALYNWVYPISYGVSGLLLSHFLMMGGIEVSGRADVPRVVAEGTTLKVFSNAARSIRRKNWGQYWKACWFLPLIMILFFSLGVYGGSFITTTNSMIPTVIGLAAGALGYLIFLPYHAEVNSLLMESWEKDIFVEAAKQMRDLLVAATMNHTIDEHGSTFYLKRVEKLEKALQEGNYREVKPEESEENPEE